MNTVESNKVAVTRNGCVYTVAPAGHNEANAADRLAPALQGETSFVIAIASDGGHTLTPTITVDIGLIPIPCSLRPPLILLWRLVAPVLLM